MDISNELIKNRRSEVFIHTLFFLIFFPIMLMSLYDNLKYMTISEAIVSWVGTDFVSVIIIVGLLIWVLVTVGRLVNWVKFEQGIRLLFREIPSLNRDFSNLAQADYIDEKLRILVYDHYLFYLDSYDYDYLDLNNCQQLYTERQDYPNGRRYCVKAIMASGEECEFRCNKGTGYRERLEELYTFLGNLYEEGEV